MIAPATAPTPKIEPIQYICADVAAAPLKAPMAVPVDAEPNAEINISMPPIVAAPVILPVAICATRRARRARRLETWLIAAMIPFRSRSTCRNCFFVFTQLVFPATGLFVQCNEKWRSDKRLRDNGSRIPVTGALSVATFGNAIVGKMDAGIDGTAADMPS